MKNNKIYIFTKFIFINLFKKKSYIFFLLFLPLIFYTVLLTSFIPAIYTINTSFFVSSFFVSSFTYGVVFFNLKKTKTYDLLDKEINSKFKTYFSIYLVFFIILIINTILFVFYLEIFNLLNLLFNTSFTHTGNYLCNIATYQYDNIFYYLFVFSLVNFCFLFFIQNLLNNFQNYLLITLTLTILFIAFSGLYSFNGNQDRFQAPGFDNYYEINWKYYLEAHSIKLTNVGLDSSGNILYNIVKMPSQEQINTNNAYGKDLNFSLKEFFTFLNPFYQVNKIIATDTFYYYHSGFAISGLTEFGYPDGIINIVHVNIFTFSSFEWTLTLVIPYVYCMFFGMMGIFIKNSKENKNDNNKFSIFLNLSLILIVFGLFSVFWFMFNLTNPTIYKDHGSLSLMQGVYYWNTLLNYDHLSDPNYIDSINKIKDAGVNTHVNLFNFQDNFNKLTNLFTGTDPVLDANSSLIPNCYKWEIILISLNNSLYYAKADITLFIILIEFMIVLFSSVLFKFWWDKRLMRG